MNKLKNALALTAIVVSTAVLISACNAEDAPIAQVQTLPPAATTTVAATTPESVLQVTYEAIEIPDTAETPWLNIPVGPAAGNHNLGVVFIPETGEFILPGPTNDWAAQYISHYIPYEELVRRAMEEGEVNWAASGSRAPGDAASFEALYPGITVNIHNIGTVEMLERFPREHAAGIRALDVIRMNDYEGVVYREFLAESLFHNYFPYDIVPHVYDPVFLTTGMPSHVTYNVIFYNYLQFPYEPPITSWWDLTKPQWESRIIAPNPITNPRYLAIFTTFVMYADEFATEYERVFGEPITLSPNAPTAAHEWAIRFFANDPIWSTSDAESNRTVGSADQDEIFLGWASSSGIRRNSEEGLHLAFGSMTPALAPPGMGMAFIMDEAPNPHAAMLLARFLVGGQGETLGIGTIDRNLEGSWLTRRDIERHPLAPAALDELLAFTHNAQFIYDNSPAVFDFLLTLQ